MKIFRGKFKYNLITVIFLSPLLNNTIDNFIRRYSERKKKSIYLKVYSGTFPAGRQRRDKNV